MQKAVLCLYGSGLLTASLNTQQIKFIQIALLLQFTDTMQCVTSILFFSLRTVLIKTDFGIYSTRVTYFCDKYQWQYLTASNEKCTSTALFQFITKPNSLSVFQNLNFLFILSVSQNKCHRCVSEFRVVLCWCRVGAGGGGDSLDACKVILIKYFFSANFVNLEGSANEFFVSVFFSVLQMI
jgi:hypothetical protein